VNTTVFVGSVFWERGSVDMSCESGSLGGCKSDENTLRFNIPVVIVDNKNKECGNEVNVTSIER